MTEMREEMRENVEKMTEMREEMRENVEKMRRLRDFFYHFLVTALAEVLPRGVDDVAGDLRERKNPVRDVEEMREMRENERENERKCGRNERENHTFEPSIELALVSWARSYEFIKSHFLE